MAGAVLLNLVIAAAAGVLIPLGLQPPGRIPRTVRSVLLTFVTDAMGFFLFLGLATGIPRVAIVTPPSSVGGGTAVTMRCVAHQAA